MALPDIDIIATKILFDAKDAILALQAWNSALDKPVAKIQFLKKLISSTAAQMGGDLKAATSAVGKFSNALEMNPALIRKVGSEMQNVGKSAESGFGRAVTAVNALRIAMGVLVSMLIFQVIQAFGNTFRTAIANLRETELAVYNLINAERRLSEQGIDVTPKGLKETIEAVKTLVPVLSEIQVEELVSRVATNVAPALKLSNDQIRQMSESVALLYVRNKALGYSFDEVEKAITDAFLTGKVSQGINKFGVKLSDQIVKDEALRLGLVQTEEQFNSLTGEMEAQIKAAAMLSVVYKNAQQDVGSLGEYMKTADAQISRVSVTWNNLLTRLAEIATPVIVSGMERLASVLETLLKIIEANEAKLQRFTARFVVLANFTRDPSLIFRADPRDMFKEIMDSYNALEQAVDTPTADVPLYDALADTDEAEKALDDLEEKIEDIILDAQHAREDLRLKFDQKQFDIDVEYDRKKIDEATRHSQKLQDINQDALDKIEDAKRKSREDEKKAEQDLLQKLKELRQRFLMDLEDALHARDARQILRLIREYNFEKQNILDRKKLDDQQRKDKLAEDLKAIEIERQRKIEQEKIEHRRRLEDLALAKKRELEELDLWYQREQEDIQRNIEQKLQKLLNGYITEGKITEEQMSIISGILAKHFGDQMGMVDSLVAYMQTRFAQMAAMSVVPTMTPGAPAPTSMFGNSGYGASFSSGASITTRTPSAPTGRIPRYGDGGTLFAKKPTLALFGEKSPEYVRFTPASQMGHGGGGMGEGINGTIGLELTLSPDLEARVVKNAMNNTARVVTKIRRSKNAGI